MTAKSPARNVRPAPDKVLTDIADYVANLAKDPEKIGYGIYVRDHLFVLQVYDQWRAHGSLPLLIEMYGPCRRAHPSRRARPSSRRRPCSSNRSG